MKIYCTHVSCRLDALAELSSIRAVQGRPMTDEQIRSRFLTMREDTVRCRLVPRVGPVAAPFPGGGT